MINRILCGAAVFAILFTAVHAETSFRGYSGAPGSRGFCASSCHGSAGGSIQIAGFPDEYLPGETYQISVIHSGDLLIRQFNGSCRVGTGSATAGMISSGFRTSTYSVNEEPNGIHLLSSSQDSATFSWTAPEPGVGEVRLYIAGLQGGYGGQNTNLMLISNEGAVGIDDNTSLPGGFKAYPNYPNPFNASTTISFELQYTQNVKISIYNLKGQLVQNIVDSHFYPGYHSIKWDAVDLPSGVYLYKIEAGDRVFTNSMTLLK